MIKLDSIKHFIVLCLFSFYFLNLPFVFSQTLSEMKEKSELLVDSGKGYEEAFTYFSNILKNNPDNEFAYYAQYQLGRIYYRDKYYQKAREEFQKVIDKYPDSEKAPAASWMIGYTFLQKKDYANALNSFQYYVDKYPNHKMISDAKERIAAIKHINRDLFSSIEAYKNVIAEAQASEEKAKAQVEIAGLTFEIAKGEDMDYRPENSKEIMEWLNKAREECMKVFDYEANRQSKAVAELMYFETYLNENELDKCIELGKKFLENYPDQKREYYMAKYTIGSALLQKGSSEYCNEAIKYFDEILADDVKEEELFGNANVQAMAAFAKAEYYEKIGNIGKAKEMYRLIKEKYPKTKESLASTFNLGELIRKYGE